MADPVQTVRELLELSAESAAHDADCDALQAELFAVLRWVRAALPGVRGRYLVAIDDEERWEACIAPEGECPALLRQVRDPERLPPWKPWHDAPRRVRVIVGARLAPWLQTIIDELCDAHVAARHGRAAATALREAVDRLSPPKDSTP